VLLLLFLFLLAVCNTFWVLSETCTLW
jgi:hypothetical protein